jgi:hypothetical protein
MECRQHNGASTALSYPFKMTMAANSNILNMYLALCTNEDQRGSVRRRFVRIVFTRRAAILDTTLTQQMLDGEMAGIWATWTRAAHNLRAHMGAQPLSECGCGMVFGDGDDSAPPVAAQRPRQPPIDVLLSTHERGGERDTLMPNRDIIHGLGGQVLDATGLANVCGLSMAAIRTAMVRVGTGQIAASGARRSNAANRGVWGAPPARLTSRARARGLALL